MNRNVKDAVRMQWRLFVRDARYLLAGVVVVWVLVRLFGCL